MAKALSERQQRALTEREAPVRVLTESTIPTLQLVEQKGRPDVVVVRGEFARADRPTGNRRIYERKLFEREIKRLGKAIKERKVLGEIDHPAEGAASLKHVSHVLTDLSIDDDGVVIGEAEILPTDAGRNLAAILRAKCKVGVSSRGFGTTRMSEGQQHELVNNDYVLHTFDFVLDPADSDAYPGMLGESVKAAMLPNVENDAPRESLLADSERLGYERGLSEGIARAERDFAENLPEVVEGIKEGVRKEILDEMRASRVGPEADVLEQVKRLIAPLLRPADYERSVNESQDRAATAEVRLAQITEEHKALGVSYRAMVYESYLAKELPAGALTDRIVEGLGDLRQYESSGAFTARLNEVRAAALTEDRAVRDRSAAALAGENAELRVKARIEEACARHPQEVRLRDVLQAAKPVTVEAVDAIVEGFGRARPPTGTILERTRALLNSSGRGRPVTTVQEGRQSTRQATKGGGGLTIEELRARIEG